MTGRVTGARLAALLAGTALAGAFAMAPGAALAQDTAAVAGAGGATNNPAEDAAQGDAIDANDIIVTAQKRSENLQDVPIAITAIGTERLDELQVQAFEDYARYLPSVSIQTGGPGNAKVYFRGVASGENANHSTSQPSVGVYLDEQPITTITGALDVHVYDIARVEALAGPQGTLYGASSQAGTIRLITNRPDTSSFYGEVGGQVSKTSKGGWGYVGEGFVNAPLSPRAALRVVGWYKRDAGYIDNIPGTLTFPSSGIRFDNAGLVEADYNDVDTYGGRAALAIDLDDDWTITPQIMGQKQTSFGSFATERGLGDLQVQQFNPERFDDDWYQAALTVEGKIGNWDVTYAGAYLKRRVDGASDYVDYAYFYDALAGYGNYFYDNAGNLVNPNQYIESVDRFTKTSHELRFASPSDEPVRAIIGAFYQRQSHGIEQNYIIDDIADAITVPGTDSNIWLTKQRRVDRDYAVFGEVTADVTDQLSVTLGTRIYRYDNSLVGFFGYSAGFSSRTGVAACFGPPQVDGSPCTNVDKRTADSDFLHKINVTYKVTPDALVYATHSRGYRPGGINRRGSLPPYAADFIDNWEVGWKTSWADNRIRWNGAAYQLDWSDLQLSFLGQNGLTEVRNAGFARIRGIETDVWLRPADGFTLAAGMAFNDARITRDFCRIANTRFDCAQPGRGGEDNALLAPAGTRLPVTARFKANALARYEFPLGTMDGHVQAGVIHEGRRTSDLRLAERAIKEDLPAYTTLDLSAGIKNDRYTFELFATNVTDKRGYSTVGLQCNESICGDPDGATAIGPKTYRTVIRPRMVGLKGAVRF